MSDSNDYRLEALSSPEYGELVESGRLVVLLPVGSVEPHGPHMTLVTDTIISLGAAQNAAAKLEERGFRVVIAPAIPYGVTECAAAFPGAISVDEETLVRFAGAVVDGYLRGGALHVCLVNNHLEPAQDQAIRKVLEGRSQASVACPLTRKWARTLTAEFKRGACHAGQYETSIVMACEPELVADELRQELGEVDVSLSDNIRNGITDFAQMGMSRAYSGTPAGASAEEGRVSLELLGDMIVGEVLGVCEPSSALEG